MPHDGDYLARCDPFEEFEEAGPGVESANVGIRETLSFACGVVLS